MHKELFSQNTHFYKILKENTYSSLINMQIKKPIFIMGIPRSGTTILYRLFTQHRDVAYFENYCSRLANHPSLFRFIPLLLKYQKLRYNITRPKPSVGDVWDQFYKRLDRLDETRLNERIKNYYYSAIKAELKTFNVTRFVNKRTDHCLRIRWLNAMFPDSYFILIRRDPKSIISSNRVKITQKIELSYNPDSPYHAILKRFQKNCTIIESIIKYHNYVNEILSKDLPIIKDRTKEIHYADFVKNPRDVLRSLFEFIEFQWYDKLEQFIPKQLEQQNDEKWKSLPEEEKNILEQEFSVF